MALKSINEIKILIHQFKRFTEFVLIIFVHNSANVTIFGRSDSSVFDDLIKL